MILIYKFYLFRKSYWSSIKLNDVIYQTKELLIIFIKNFLIYSAISIQSILRYCDEIMESINIVTLTSLSNEII